MSMGPPKWSDLYLSDKIVLFVFLAGPVLLLVSSFVTLLR